MNENLVMSRPMAIDLLHRAQVAAPDQLRGWVLSKNDAPVRFRPLTEVPEGDPVWARLWTVPTSAAVPNRDELNPGERALVISLGTKGVLEMRAWTLSEGGVKELPLSIID